MNKSTTREASAHHSGIPLRILRESLSLTQAELARAASVQTKYLALVEDGLRTPNAQWTEKVARVLYYFLIGQQARNNGSREVA